MSHCLKHWSRWCQCACCLLVLRRCLLEERLCPPSYSYSELDLWLWLFLLISAKQFTYFLGCILGLSTALVITSILGVQFLALPFFLSDI